MADIILHDINDDSDELNAGKILQQVFMSSLSNTPGKIWIIPSINVHPGTGRHDVDILIIGKFETG